MVVEEPKAEQSATPVGSGPHPTLAVVKYRYGIVEIIFRLVLIVSYGISSSLADYFRSAGLDINYLPIQTTAYHVEQTVVKYCNKLYLVLLSMSSLAAVCCNYID